MNPNMVGKLAPNSSHLTRELIKYVTGRGYFRAVSYQNGDKMVTSPPSTIVELVRCGEIRARSTDIKELCPPRARPTHGHAAPGRGSSGFNAGLVSLPAIHKLPLDDSSGDADCKVDAHPPCPIQIGVCPQSQQPPDTGTPASQLTAVSHTQDCAATRTAAVIPHHFLDA